MPKANSEGVSIDYEVRGSGPPLAMIAGFSSSRITWREALISLLEPHFRLILMDNRGTGLSDKPEPLEAYSIDLMAGDVVSVLDDLGIHKINLFGVSMGGRISQRFALKFPDRLNALVLGCTRGGGDMDVAGDPKYSEMMMMRLKEGIDPYEGFVAREPAVFTDVFREANRPFLDQFFEESMVNPTPIHALKGQRHAIQTFDNGGRLGEIRVPTRVVTGDSDRIAPPENSERIANRIPGAELVVISDAGHCYWIEKPIETADSLISFFPKHPGGE